MARKALSPLYLGLILVLIASLTLSLGFWLGNSKDDAEIPPANAFLNSLHPKTQVLLQAPPLTPFTLLDYQQQKFTLMNLNRQWSLLFFGYTYCPDICPTALMVLNEVYKNLETQGDAENVQVIFVSVDPPRDTSEQIAAYISYFNKKFIGVTGNAQQIREFATQLGVAYTQVPQAEGGTNYLVDHSAAILLVDPLGRFRASFLPPHTSSQIVEDFRKIRAYYAEECCLPPGEVKTTIIKGRSPDSTSTSE